MNCAPVTVVGQAGSSFTGPRMHEANIFGGTCITPENIDVVYPNPGPSVQFGGKYVGGNTGPPTVLTPSCAFDQNVNLTTTGGGAVTGGTEDPPAAGTDLHYLEANRRSTFELHWKRNHQRYSHHQQYVHKHDSGVYHRNRYRHCYARSSSCNHLRN